MRKQGHGRILFNSSILGFAAMRWRGAYNASKYGMQGICDTLRQELVRSNIYVSLIETGLIISRFRSNALINFRQNIHSLLPEACLKACLRALNSAYPAACYRGRYQHKFFCI